MSCKKEREREKKGPIVRAPYNRAVNEKRDRYTHDIIIMPVDPVRNRPKFFFKRRFSFAATQKPPVHTAMAIMRARGATVFRSAERSCSTHTFADDNRRCAAFANAFTPPEQRRCSYRTVYAFNKKTVRSRCRRPSNGDKNNNERDNIFFG